MISCIRHVPTSHNQPPCRTISCALPLKGDSTISSSLPVKTDSTKNKLKALSRMGLFTQVQKSEQKWQNKVDKFAAKTVEKEKKEEQQSKKKKSILLMSSAKRKEKIKEMFRDSYRRHHPRRVIMEYFNDVAREGAHDIEASGTVKKKRDLHPMLRYFNRASVFTVWRPTSMDAMIRMIRHEAIGKGLDIKAKSALRGDLSGFVPFLQIGDNKLKSQIGCLPMDGTVKLFFKTKDEGGEISRAKVAKKLRYLANSIHDRKSLKIMRAISKATDAITQIRLFEDLNDLNKKWSSIRKCSITMIDEYAPARYGLEFPVLLFWEAFVASQDITRVPGSKYYVGRESCLTSQDWNLSTLCSKQNSTEHRVVLLQTASNDDPMNPFNLLMAYELEKRKEVLPVVSDCDCFLVGTRRVTYKTPINLEQMDVMKWSLSQVENILETPERGSFKDQWYGLLDQATKDGFKLKMPSIGFGDPKSCSIMENAVQRLTGSGGVRHGAESFNYHIPQDLGDEFVIIAEDLPNNVAWIKVNGEELCEFLSDKIDHGYTFPLNPKWIISDSGKWKTLYDKLLSSENENTIASMNIWFPPESGIREQIGRISERFPNGFERESTPSMVGQ